MLASIRPGDKTHGPAMNDEPHDVPGSTPGKMEKHGYCTLCRSRCGTVNVVENDTLLSVRPDPAHPTGKAMCLKGKSAPELVHSAERILHPMRRTNPKTDPDPGWQRISWDEALAEIAARMLQARRESGAESVAFAVTTPSGTPLSDSIDWIERFIRLFGSPNTCYATEICNWHKDYAHAFTFGCGMPTADYRQAGLIVLWGHNPANTWLSQADAIGAGRKAGARLLVVDPRETALAAQADQWLRVCPGTDATLALAIANLLIEANAFDLDFVRQWTNGPLLVRSDNGRFLRGRDVGLADGDAYLAWNARAARAQPWSGLRPADFPHVALRGTFSVGDAGAPGLPAIACRPAFDLYAEECARYPAALAAELTWVPEGDIRQAAGLFASAGPVAYHAWSGVGQHDNATQTDRAIACLYALTGSFDRAGGNRVYQKPPYNPVSGFGLLPPEQKAKALGYGERPLGPPAQGWITARDLYRAILHAQPYRVRALVAFGTNPLLSQADVEDGARALRSLDFYAHCDLFETPSARYADILLPVNTPWEREGLRIGFEISAEAEQLVQLRQRMVSPRGESRSDNDIVFDLALRLGMSDAFFGGSLEAGWNHMLAPSGLTVSQLRQHPEGIRVPVADVERKYAAKPRGRAFDTQTGVVELYSELLLRHGYPALPRPSSPTEHSPAASNAPGAALEPFPFMLTSAKSGYYCHSQHRGLPSLRRKAPRPEAEISTALAAARGIASGDAIRVSTSAGSATFTARVREGLHPRVVIGEFGWWQRCDALAQAPLPVAGPGNSNYNGLIGTDSIDPLSGSVPLRAFRCNVEREPGLDVARRAWEGYRAFRVAGLRKEAHEVTSVFLEPADGGGLPDFLPGQHVTIQLAAQPGGEDAVRSYSLTGPATVPGRRGYSISVRRAGGAVPGLVSSHINQRLAVGDAVALRAPSGTFVMPVRTRRPLVLLAGGIGITPFLSLLESLEGVDDPPRILLLYANRNGQAHAFRARLRALRRQIRGLEIIDFYDCPDPHDRPGTDYDVAGRVGAGHVPAPWLAARPLVYMCGPAPMMTAFADGLAALGVHRSDIFREVFRAPGRAPAGPAQQFRVVFARSGMAGTWHSAHGPLLGFAERLGVALPSGCRVGQCESCAVPVASGQVRHLHGEDPEDPGMCLACQAIPASDLVLDA